MISRPLWATYVVTPEQNPSGILISELIKDRKWVVEKFHGISPGLWTLLQSTLCGTCLAQLQTDGIFGLTYFIHTAKKFPSTKFFISKPTALYSQNLVHASASGPIFLLPRIALDKSSNRIQEASGRIYKKSCLAKHCIKRTLLQCWVSFKIIFDGKKCDLYHLIPRNFLNIFNMF